MSPIEYGDGVCDETIDNRVVPVVELSLLSGLSESVRSKAATVAPYVETDSRTKQQKLKDGENGLTGQAAFNQYRNFAWKEHLDSIPIGKPDKSDSAPFRGYSIDVKTESYPYSTHMLVNVHRFERQPRDIYVSVHLINGQARVMGWAWRREVAAYPAASWPSSKRKSTPVHAVPFSKLHECKEALSLQPRFLSELEPDFTDKDVIGSGS